MRHSRRSLEGYLQIDHRNSPGVTAAEVRAAGLDPSIAPALAEGQQFESATISCSHCQAIVVLNPLRTRPRTNCPRCDHYVCDNPLCQMMAAGTVPHRSFQQVMEDALEATVVTSSTLVTL